MSSWQDATVNNTTGEISGIGSGSDKVRVLAPGFYLTATTAQVGFGVQIIKGGGSGVSGDAPTMQFDDELNSQLVALLADDPF